MSSYSARRETLNCCAMSPTDVSVCQYKRLASFATAEFCSTLTLPFIPRTASNILSA